MLRRPLDARSPVVLFANAIGDHLLCLPALRALVHLFPGRLRLLGLPVYADILLGNVEFDSVVPLPVIKVLSGQGIEFDAEKTCDAIAGCDLFMSLVPWHTASVSQLLGRLNGIESIGYFQGFRKILALRYDQHSFDLAFDLPRHFDSSLSLEAFSGPPTVPSVEKIQALITGYRVLVIHADTQPAKMWPWDSFVRVLRRFFSAHPDFVGLLIGKTHLSIATDDLEGHLISCLDLAIPETLAIVGMADLFLGVDSCFLHAADLFRVPGVGLFGPTNPDEFGFRFSQHRHLYGSSMAAISEDAVDGALDQLLSTFPELRVPNCERESLGKGTMPTPILR